MTQADRGRPLTEDEPIDQKMNVKLTSSLKDQLVSRHKKTGVTPSAQIRRALKGQPVILATESDEAREDVKDALRSVMQEMQAGQICISLDKKQQEQLEATAAKLGVLDSSGLLKAMALKAIKDPAFVEGLLTASVLNGFKASAQAELDKRPSATKRTKAA